MRAHLLDTPPAPSSLRPDVPAELDAIVARALAKDPAERYAERRRVRRRARRVHVACGARRRSTTTRLSWTERPLRSRAAAAAAAPVAAPEQRSRNPIDRLTHGMPKSWRITLDWLVTIVGAILIVLAIKQWVDQPVPDPVQLDGADAPLRAARQRVRGGHLRPRARLPLLLPPLGPEARRHHRLQHAAAGGAGLRLGRSVRQAPGRPSRRDVGGAERLRLHQRQAPRRAVHQAGATRRRHATARTRSRRGTTS